MITETMPAVGQADANLVAESLAGSREAFRQIVERYQTLICSLAYNATGSVSQSEDVAQETFISAWKDLPTLREPDKLRAWLCGIVRNRIQRSLRDEGRQLVCAAAPLEHADDTPADEALPSDQAISQEEEVILWRSLEKIPELYRETLILFYREHQSIAAVAAELELTEDTVKQRLSRGRKRLQEEVQTFLESALRRTAPGREFSNAVFAALPVAAGSATTASLGAGAKGAAAVKSGLLAAGLGPLVGLTAGFASQWFVIRAHTPEHRRRALLLKLIVTWACLLALPFAGDTAVRSLGENFGWSDRARFASVAGFWGIVAVLLATWLILMFRRELAVHQQRSEEAMTAPRSPLVPLTRAHSALIVASIYLTIFSWLICVTWRVHDWTVAAGLVGPVPVLSVWSFFRLRSKTGAGPTRAAYSYLTWCCVVVVAVINLRLDVWMAAARGVSVNEVRELLPFWIVPLLSLILLIWTVVAVILTRPKTNSRLIA